ncbi:HAD family hydrolase [Phytomonospora endophytica]|uniref:Putative hydrolase of the HAD superfamily n=1 Tax=Phytomonospora endophytica TaxID=714109 RepID=A0A841FMP1_9ACTN|nr:HAD family hydrolase [Phytomonospora endophytica]MBB6033879.1 putative hydrolase of the HAD superfamily [Phytomonospora endophytica]
MTLLLIDLDNTLIDRDAAFRTGVRELLVAHALPVGDVDWVMEVDASGYTPRPTVAAAVAARYRETGLGRDEILEMLFQGAREHARITSGTRAALIAAAGAGHRVVIVTNGMVGQQEAKIRNAGLDALVDGWVVSEGVGVKKPAPGIFRAAADLVGASLDGAWVIGDRDDADIAGAHALGLSSVWLSLGRDWTITEFAPTATARTVAEAVGKAVAG